MVVLITAATASGVATQVTWGSSSVLPARPLAPQMVLPARYPTLPPLEVPSASQPTLLLVVLLPLGGSCPPFKGEASLPCGQSYGLAPCPPWPLRLSTASSCLGLSSEDPLHPISFAIKSLPVAGAPAMSAVLGCSQSAGVGRGGSSKLAGMSPASPDGRK
jgi:hypothetical protein